MTLLVAWAVFPLLLGAICLGCGLLVRQVSGASIHGALLPAVGLATVIVVGQFATMSDATAELATPAVIALAVAGFGLCYPLRRFPVNRWAVVVAIAVFAVYAAPIVLSGKATFAGYIRLDDTATWMALTDRVMEHGRSLEGLVPSTYEATLAFNLGAGYPIGVFLPLGIGHQILGTDVAWLVQPYMAFLAALLGLALWDLARVVSGSAWLRGLAAFLGAQSALLMGYYLWGGIKEVAAAALIATLAALAGRCIRARFAPGTIVPLAVVSAALVGVLSAGGAFWVAPILVATAAFAIRLLGRQAALGRAVGFAALTLFLCIPVFSAAGLIPPTSSSLTDESAQGNLFHPLSVAHIFGVWPSGDFRVDPIDQTATVALILAAALAATLGVIHAWWRRQWPFLLYVGGAVLSGLAIFLIGSPWIGAKALATAAPAIPFAATVGAAALWLAGRRVEGGVLLAALAAGVLWSNALAYRDVNLAPRDQLAELETIGERIAGEGPTLMTEYQPYGARHFLRDADAEAASELRRNVVPLRSGHGLAKGRTADTDRFQLDGLLFYRTLVLRRAPFQSRPPAPYSLTWRGDYYEVWQRPVGGGSEVIDHLGLGNVVDPAGTPGCDEVRRLAAAAGPAGSLAAVSREHTVVVPLDRTRHPAAWESSFYAHSLVPVGAGTIVARVRIPGPGDFYEVWLGGGVRPEVNLSVDGNVAGSVRHQLQNYGEYVRLGEIPLKPGPHTVRIRFHGPDLHPGSGGDADPIGPLVLSRQDAGDTEVRSFDPADAEALCAGTWDWIEALGP